MENEFETQVLDVDARDITKKLLTLGAVETPECLQRRWVFDFDSDNGGRKWIRLRTNGTKTTICYKDRVDNSVNGTTEIEITVDDFDKAYELLSKMNFYPEKYYQEDKATFFHLNDIEFKIDQWPMIPPVLEIEAKNEEKVSEGLKLLGLEGKEYGHHGYVTIYKKYGIDLHSYRELRFENE
jgi:adenylate cyclase class 2